MWWTTPGRHRATKQTFTSPPAVYESCRIFAIASCLRFIANHIKPTFLPTFASEFTAKYSINRSILVNINWIGVWHVARVCRPVRPIAGFNVNRAKFLWKFSPKKAFLCVFVSLTLMDCSRKRFYFTLKAENTSRSDLFMLRVMACLADWPPFVLYINEQSEKWITSVRNNEID